MVMPVISPCVSDLTFITQVGCSNWKRVFLILAGIVDPGDRVRPSIEVFRQVNSLENYTPKEQEYRLRYIYVNYSNLIR